MYVKSRVKQENTMTGFIASTMGYNGTLNKDKKIWDAGAIVMRKLVAGKSEDATLMLTFEGMVSSIRAMNGSIKSLEDTMITHVKELPIYEWAMTIPGVGAISLAIILAEIGNLSDYSNPSKVWKRMGCGVIRGERQRKVAGDKELAIEHGYDGQRRSLIWSTSKYIGMQRKRMPNHPLIQYMVAEKDRQLANGLTKGQAENRARIHTGKKFLKWMWKEWNRAVPA